MDTELGRSKDAFLAIISHELRTPLTEIIAALHLLRDCHYGELNQDQLDYVHIADDAASRLDELIGDLISFAKISGDNTETHCAPESLSDLVREVVVPYRFRAQGKQIRLTFEHDKDLPPIILDRTLMKRVVANLIANAITYTPQGGHVQVRVCGNDSPMGTQCIRVEDSGVGIPKERQASLFESFYQANDPMTRSYGGLGIGLAYAKQIVQAHQGRIGFVSEEGKGSTFTVCLPPTPNGGKRPLNVR